MATSEAPGRLELVRGFINSVEIEEGANPLSGPDNLRQWCETTGVCPGIDEPGLVRLRQFREALRAVLETHVGEGDALECWRALEPFAAQSGYRLHITEQGLPALRPEGTGADAAIAELFAIAYDAIGAGTWQRLKACRKHSCRWAFYDRSKNGSGAWCNMAVCGNREKAHRRRLSRKNAAEK